LGDSEATGAAADVPLPVTEKLPFAFAPPPLLLAVKLMVLL
jgi:hypothetical protein